MRGFFNKVAEHIDKLDAEGQRAQYRLLVKELSFYESVFRSLREGVLVVDADGTTVYANEAVARLTGFDGAKARGRPVRHLLPDWDWDTLYNSRAEVKIMFLIDEGTVTVTVSSEVTSTG